MSGRLVLWNIDNTLIEAGKVTREAYAEAFHAVVGRPLTHVAPMAGRAAPEVIFETLALAGVEPGDHHLPEFCDALADAFATRRGDLKEHGRVLPGAERALVALQRSTGVVQSVLTGNIRASAVAKLSAFGLDSYLDLDIGGYASDNFPKGTLVQVARSRARGGYGEFDQSTAVVIADSIRDVRAARIGEAAVIAVASGRETAADLRDEGADEVLEDLSDTEDVVSTVRRLTSGSPG